MPAAALETLTLTLCPHEQDEPAINYDELESLFQIMESSALRKLTKARAAEIRLIEHRRAHNISIELSGIRKPYSEIRVRDCEFFHILCWSLPRWSQIRRELARVTLIHSTISGA